MGLLASTTSPNRSFHLVPIPVHTHIKALVGLDICMKNFFLHTMATFMILIIGSMTHLSPLQRKLNGLSDSDEKAKELKNKKSKRIRAINAKYLKGFVTFLDGSSF